MTSNPYTPDEAELIGCYAGAMEEQAGRTTRRPKRTLNAGSRRFTTADYATHPKGGTAVRDRGDGYWPWKVSYHREVEGPWLSDIK